jgi:hypothetical protein
VPLSDWGCDEYHLDRSRLPPGATVPDDADLTPTQRRRRAEMEAAKARLARVRRTDRRRERSARKVAAKIEKPRVTHVPLSLGDDEEESMHRDELKRLLSEVLDEALGVGDIELHPRYEGGKLLITPANPELQAKEVPIDVFFRKITTVRDKLRVLEQKVNNAEISDGERAQWQGYITGAYGALKTFNFLFADREDYFGS